ncbi:unnamed protein product [Callosobruchus maculatus]|uniref:Uncharacterized protein n=1 Tax=Callosobruchus maculatus TaxID=64391 RepID=A0A653C535_CALMS|nr:unnamed protein product [Callosobruchus maculatus]
MLVETWLNEEEAPFYNINNYQAVHCFREGRGGGASIYVREGISVQVVDKSNEQDSVNWVCVNLGEKHKINNLAVVKSLETCDIKDLIPALGDRKKFISHVNNPKDTQNDMNIQIVN